MLGGLESLKDSINWSHVIPFAALVVGKPVPENRPAMTRIIEQSFVGVVSAAVASFVTINVHQVEIDNIKAQRVESEARTAKALTDSELRLANQISELRTVMLQKK